MNFRDPPPMPEQFNHWCYVLRGAQSSFGLGRAPGYGAGLVV